MNVAIDELVAPGRRNEHEGSVACRTLVSEFLWLDPADLAGLGRWLGRYQDVTRTVRAREDDGPSSATNSVPPAIAVQDIVEAAQREVVRCLGLMGESGGYAVVADVVSARNVVLGPQGWIAVRRGRMKLVDRVMSLVAVPHLNSSEELAPPDRPRESGFVTVQR